MRHTVTQSQSQLSSCVDPVFALACLGSFWTLWTDQCHPNCNLEPLLSSLDHLLQFVLPRSLHETTRSAPEETLCSKLGLATSSWNTVLGAKRGVARPSHAILTWPLSPSVKETRDKASTISAGLSWAGNASSRDMAESPGTPADPEVTSDFCSLSKDAGKMTLSRRKSKLCDGEFVVRPEAYWDKGRTSQEDPRRCPSGVSKRTGHSHPGKNTPSERLETGWEIVTENSRVLLE